jgi:hypothetical protein
MVRHCVGNAVIECEVAMNDKKDKSPDGWAYRHAERLVAIALAASEPLGRSAQHSLLRTIARRALSRLPNAPFEARELAKAMEIESMKYPHSNDDPPGHD